MAMPIELRDWEAALPSWHSAQTLSPTNVTPGGTRVGFHLSAKFFCPEAPDETLKTTPQIRKWARQIVHIQVLFLPE
jgi:hypothetical protein